MFRNNLLAACGFAALACAVAGCGESAAPNYPVNGQVTFRKKPLADAVVTFHPKPGQPPGHTISATTDKDGRYRLTTKKPNDGAPAGEYAVTVAYLEKRKDGDEVLRNGKNLLNEKYGNPDTSGLKATVKDGDNVIEPFAVD